MWEVSRNRNGEVLVWRLAAETKLRVIGTSVKDSAEKFGRVEGSAGAAWECTAGCDGDGNSDLLRTSERVLVMD